MGGTYFGVNLPKQLHCILVFIICSTDTAVGWKEKSQGILFTTTKMK